MADPKKGHLSRSKSGGTQGRHEASIKHLHDGFHVTKTHGDGAKTEHAHESLEEAIESIKSHMNEGALQDPSEEQELMGSEQEANGR